VQAESGAHLRELLSVAAGGVVFTTIHKSFPEEKGDRHPTLSERRNIVMIADEAHRSQCDFITSSTHRRLRTRFDRSSRARWRPKA
jgi:type I restriction enzyme R subunit